MFDSRLLQYGTPRYIHPPRLHPLSAGHAADTTTLAKSIPSLAARELLATPKGAMMVVPSPEGRRLSSSYSSPRPASSTSLLRKPPVSRKPYSLPHTLPPIPPPLPHPPRSHPRPPRPPRPPTFPPQSRPLHSLTSPPIIPSSPPPPLPTPPPLPQSILPPSPPSLMSTLAFLDAIDSVTSITYLISMCGNNPVSDVGVRGGVCLNLGHATACIWASAILGPHSGPTKSQIS